MGETATYEVTVVVRRKGSYHYSSHNDGYIENSVVKTFHKDARTAKQAIEKCRKLGRPLSACKVKADEMFGDVRSFLLPKTSNPYPNAIAMDEFVWQKVKRSERIESNGKHKDVDY